MRRRSVTWLVVVVLAVGGGFGLYWFQPWKLFTSTEVADAIPSLAPAGSTAPPPSAAPAVSGSPANGASPAGAAPPTRPAGNRLLVSGALVSHEHDTTGTVQVIQLQDGRRQLVLRDLATSDGPDLRIWLTDQRVVAGTAGWRVFDDGRHVEVGALKGNRGNQVYDLPATLNIDEFRSVTIWCKRFSVSFGAANLA